MRGIRSLLVLNLTVLMLGAFGGAAVDAQTTFPPSQVRSLCERWSRMIHVGE